MYNIPQGRKFIAYIPSSAFVKGKGYRVSIVVDGECGHFPTGNTDEQQEPWYWGSTYEEAVACARRYNQSRGISELEELNIMLNSMFGPAALAS